MTPLLEVLRDHGELDRHTAADLVVRHMGLTPEQIALSHETSGSQEIWAFYEDSLMRHCHLFLKRTKAWHKTREW